MTQDDLAKGTGISKSSIANIEAGRVEPETRTLRKIEECFGEHGVFFSANGVEKRDFVLTTYKDYVAVLDDIERSVAAGGEILFHCADDRRSSPAVAERLSAMRTAGYRFRSTICQGNTTILGDLADYRWIPADYFAGSEICVIYGDKYMQHVPGRSEQNFVVMKSAVHAAAMRRQFDCWWSSGKPVGGIDVRIDIPAHLRGKAECVMPICGCIDAMHGKACKALAAAAAAEFRAVRVVVCDTLDAHNFALPGDELWDAALDACAADADRWLRKSRPILQASFARVDVVRWDQLESAE